MLWGVVPIVTSFFMWYKSMADSHDTSCIGGAMGVTPAAARTMGGQMPMTAVWMARKRLQGQMRYNGRVRMRKSGDDLSRYPRIPIGAENYSTFLPHI